MKEIANGLEDSTSGSAIEQLICINSCESCCHHYSEVKNKERVL